MLSTTGQETLFLGALLTVKASVLREQGVLAANEASVFLSGMAVAFPHRFLNLCGAVVWVRKWGARQNVVWVFGLSGAHSKFLALSFIIFGALNNFLTSLCLFSMVEMIRRAS